MTSSASISPSWLFVVVMALAIAQLDRLPAAADNLADLTTEQLMQRADAGDREAILELGKRGNDPSVVVFVRKFYQNSDRIFGSVSTNTQMALAKLGDQRALDAILLEVRSDDPAVQWDAVRKLTYVGGPKAIAALGRLLGDPTDWRSSKGFNPTQSTPGEEPPMDRESYPPPRYLAMKALAEIVPNPPTGAQVPRGQEDQYVEIWRQWWQQNRDSYQ